jgi:hypothetical protein
MSRVMAGIFALDTLVALAVCASDPRPLYFAWAALSAIGAVLLWLPLRDDHGPPPPMQ